MVTYIMPSLPKHTAAPLCPSDSHSMIVFALFVSIVERRLRRHRVARDLRAFLLPPSRPVPAEVDVAVLGELRVEGDVVGRAAVRRVEELRSHPSCRRPA